VNIAEKAAIAVAAIAAISLLVAIWHVLVTQANERRRTQPIVVTHEDGPRRFAGQAGGWKVLAHATNEGEGAAFNVRWGVSFYGIRFAFRLDDADPYSGNRQRVLHPRESAPPEGSLPILISSTDIWTQGKGTPEDSAFYWARYENAQGRTWETINPPARSENLRIRRVRLRRWVEWREVRRRKRFREKAVEWERKALAELREARDQ